MAPLPNFNVQVKENVTALNSKMVSFTAGWILIKLKKYGYIFS